MDIFSHDLDFPSHSWLVEMITRPNCHPHELICLMSAGWSVLTAHWFWQHWSAWASWVCVSFSNFKLQDLAPTSWPACWLHLLAAPGCGMRAWDGRRMEMTGQALQGNTRITTLGSAGHSDGETGRISGARYITTLRRDSLSISVAEKRKASCSTIANCS